MKETVEILRKNNIICKKFEIINLNTRKKINAYLGVNLKDEYCIIFKILKKSRFLNRDFEEIVKFLPDINFRYKKKVLILNSSVCSKIKNRIKDWKIIITDNG